LHAHTGVLFAMVDPASDSGQVAKLTGWPLPAPLGTGSGSRSASLAGYLVANRRGQRRDDRGRGRHTVGPPVVNRIQREGQHALVEFRKAGSVDGGGQPFHVATQFVKNGQFGVHAVSYLSRSLKEAASSNAR